MPGSVTITSGAWPDPVTSIEPTYCGLGSDVLRSWGPTTSMASRGSVASWLKEWSGTRASDLSPATLATGPSAASLRSARRRLTPRSSCTGTTACCAAGRPGHPPRCTSRRSRTSSTVWRRRWEAAGGALRPRSPTGTHPHTSSAGFRSARAAFRSRPLPADVRPARPPCHGRQREAGQPRGEPVTLDHGPGRARDVAVAKPGRAGHSAAAGRGLRACRPDDAAPPRCARRRSRRAATRRNEVEVIPAYP